MARRIKPQAVKNTEEEFALPERFEIFEHVVPFRNRDDQLEQRLRGYLLRYTDEDGQEWFSGPPSHWFSKPGYVAIPFETVEHATQAGVSIDRVWVQAHAYNTRQYETEEKLIAFHSATESNGYHPRPTQLLWRMTSAESEKLERIRMACRSLNIEYQPGKPVASKLDALRYLFSQI